MPLRGETRLRGPAALPGEASPGEASSLPRSWATCIDSAGRMCVVGGGRLIGSGEQRECGRSCLERCSNYFCNCFLSLELQDNGLQAAGCSALSVKRVVEVVTEVV
eukprot:scaffold26993_cov42-Phaeocystis_antarctica.AAC.1